jgi:hypothetical protein
MKPLFFKSTWGFERTEFPTLFPKVAALGYGERALRRLKWL